MSIVEGVLASLAAAKAAARDAAPQAPQGTVAAIGGPDPPEPSRQVRIDIEAVRAAGYLPEPGQKSKFDETCRELRRSVLAKALLAGAPATQRLVMVTSALPGEGKTFVTLNLALSMARERGSSLLLVDADLPKAHITSTLGLRGEPGLIDAMVDESTAAESLVVGTDIQGLSVLPAGRPSELATELAGGPRILQIAHSLVKRYPRRVVLFDSPPLLVSSEARALMQVPGMILLVARSGHTPVQALQDALKLIDRQKLHGAVLNDTLTQAMGTGYGYYAEPYAAPGKTPPK